MGSRRTPLVIALLCATAATASAQLPFKHQPQKDPYRDLFGKGESTKKATVQSLVSSGASPQAPFVVCGTLIVPADPTIDPKIRIAPRRDESEHTMRTVKPPLCAPQ